MAGYAAFKAKLETAERDGTPVAYSKVAVWLGSDANKHPNLMGEVNDKLFTHQQGIGEIHFCDTAGQNFVILQPPKASVSANFNEPNHLADLPAYYTTYLLDTRCTRCAELDYAVLFTWTLAEEISVTDADDVASKIAEHAHQLAAMTKLRKLSLTFQWDTSAALRASNYFDNQERLDTVKFFMLNAPNGAEMRRMEGQLQTIATNQQRQGFTVGRGFNCVEVTRDPVV